MVKPFSNPQKSIVNTSSASAKISEGCKTVVPRHDPHGPEALVMPRPSASHQVLYPRVKGRDGKRWEEKRRGKEVK